MNTIKVLILLAATLSFAVGAAFFITRNNAAPPPAAAASEATGSVPASAGEPVVARVAERELQVQSEVAAVSSSQATPGSAVTTPGSVILDQALSTLLSGQAPFGQKMAVWGQLRSAGKFDPLIAELEKRAVAQPNVPAVPAVLGQAYLQKAGTITDIREQGILGMKADQSFDAALNLDAFNWDARFWKAMAMSYWPPQLGKGPEVVEHCMELLKQQEVLPPQPQFAQTYVLLGDQYQKDGQTGQANQIWKRGLGLFPQDYSLQQKLAPAGK